MGVCHAVRFCRHGIISYSILDQGLGTVVTGTPGGVLLIIVAGATLKTMSS